MDFFDGLIFSMFDSVPESTEQARNKPRYYGIQFNFAGTLHLRIDHGERHTVNGPYVFFTIPGHFYEYGPPEGETRYHNYICTFGPRIHRYMEGGLLDPSPESPLIRIPHPEKFLHTMQEIMALNRRPGPASPRAVWLFEDLLLQVKEAEKQEKRHTPYQAASLEMLVKRIVAAPELDWDFALEAEKLHVTDTHFRRIFKEITNLPPRQFLLQSRLHKAAGLLKNTQKPIKEIAALSGWENVFYFSRLFRKRYLISPLQYRKEFHS